MQPGMRARPCESGKALPGAAGKAVTEAIVDLPLDAIRKGPPKAPRAARSYSGSHSITM